MTLLQDIQRLTESRDREGLDGQLALSLCRWLGAREVCVARVVGEPGEERWLTTGQAGSALDAPSGGHAAAPASIIDLRHQPRLDECVLWRCCLQDRDTVSAASPEGGVLLCLPLFQSGAQAAVVELHLDALPRQARLRDLLDITRIIANHHALLEYAQHDTLTGLLNRKTFDESFLRVAMPAPVAACGDDQRRARPGLGHWLALIDIDHFKAINDQHGHLIGDEVLLHMAQLMRRTFRFQDRLYRFGGEEFLVLMRCESDADARAACVRLLEGARAYRFPRVERVTVSVGFAHIEAGMSPTVAFARADRAVYHAKQHGRDQVRGYAELAQGGGVAESAQAGEMELF